MTYADLELSLMRWSGDEYAIEMRFQIASSRAKSHLLSSPLPRVRFDIDDLLAQSLDPASYGAHLTWMLFADPRLREAFAIARGQAQGAQALLRLRLRLDAADDAIYSLCWETLQDPEWTSASLKTSEM